MGNEVQVQQSAKGLSFALPASLAARMAAAGGNIQAKATVNSLLWGGKEWAMVVNGDKKRLQRRSEETGEMEPVQIVQVVVLDQSKRGRSYYEGDYDESNPRAPDCWSEDQRKPHASVEQPQCSTCELCPKAAKGSKASASNADAVACRS